MFRVLTHIIRSSYNCNYSFWYWLTGSTTICSRRWVGTDSCVSYGRYLPYDTQKCNKLNKSHLVGQLLNSIHDARTHVYIKKSCCFSCTALPVAVIVYVIRSHPIFAFQQHPCFASCVVSVVTRLHVAVSLTTYTHTAVLSQSVHGTATCRCNDTRDCIIQFLPSWRWAHVLETCRGLK